MRLFFMDYNGIVYGAYENVKNQFTTGMTKDEIEAIIIAEVIRYTKYLICEVVRPQKVTYIALDECSAACKDGSAAFASL